MKHIITHEGTKPNPIKIETVLRFPVFREYKRKFYQDYQTVNNLFKERQKVEYNKEFTDCFNISKNLLSSELVLAYPDFFKPFQLLSDTLNFGIDCVLQQNG